MSLLISETGIEPLTTAQAKAWAKIENSDEDTLVLSLITSCRKEIEAYTKNVLLAQTWQTECISDKGQTVFYSPRIAVNGATVTVDDVAYTDFALDKSKGRVRLNTQYYGDEVILIEWDIVTNNTSFAALKQALLDLITYRFYNRGLYDMPDNVKTILNMYRIFNL